MLQESEAFNKNRRLRTAGFVILSMNAILQFFDLFFKSFADHLI